MPGSLIVWRNQRKTDTAPPVGELTGLPGCFNPEANVPRFVLFLQEEPLVSPFDVPFERVVSKSKNGLVFVFLRSNSADQYAGEVVEKPKSLYFEQHGATEKRNVRVEMARHDRPVGELVIHDRQPATLKRAIRFRSAGSFTSYDRLGVVLMPAVLERHLLGQHREIPA